ncbi:MAG: adenylate/guanylate cyclase domain-containing protein [Hyphomicrobium sp. 32-62-53]|nr:MAG: adenylate/guanylate cyclase domain-containing protein [Hyphomicrobium sp. 12-62-95]OYY00339.1 MAG: adenylate/guanylate cyclase domain-containing protein [Hyphomicrobium sp. 32-62-53]
MINALKRALAPIAAGIATIGDLPQLRSLGGVIGRLAEAGTAGYPPEVKRRLMILNLISYLIVVSTLVYAIQHTVLDYATYRPIIWINLGLVVAALAVPFAHRINEVAGALIIVAAEWAALIAFSMYLGHHSGVHLQYFVGAAAPFVVFGLKRLWLIVPVILSGLALHLASWFWFPESAALIPADKEVIDSIYVQAAITTVGLIAASVFYAFRLAEQAKAETDNLLRNILPDAIVERLKAKPDAIIADQFTDASVLFADISGFVALARSLGSAKTVALLNDIVTEFDDLAKAHGVEKIKTIGDAYMVASGIPEPCDDHLLRLARMGVAMLSTVERIAAERDLPLSMRVGLASGPVMAGVIGKQKFSYDVWGDAVNLAARLENLSQPGRILVCPRCKKLLESAFRFESRGEVEIKGLGPREVFFLVSR